MQLFRSILFTGYFFLATLFFGLLILLFFWLPYRHLYKFTSTWAHSVLRALKMLCNLDYVVEGRENLPSGNHISMWKHSSTWETIAQVAVFPPQAWVLKHELMWIPFVGWAIKLMRPIAIDRGKSRAAVNRVVEQGRRRLDDGMWILIFPEGTRTAPGTQVKYGASGALLATQTGRLIVPVAHNAGVFWPRRGLLKKPGTVRVRIGPPIASAGRDARAVNDDVKTWIEKEMARLQNIPA